MNAAILLAAGSGKRMLDSVPDKILLEIAGFTLFARSLLAFREAAVAELWIVTFRDDQQRDLLACETSKIAPNGIEVVLEKGGEERRHSVRNALTKIPAEAEIIFVHDCARPMIRPESLSKLLTETRQCGGAALAHPVRDTLKRVRDEGNSLPLTEKTVDRENLWAVETPQVFRNDLLRKGMDRSFAENRSVTDETSAVELLGQPVTLIDPGYPNPKITTPEDLSYIEFLLNEKMT